MLSGYTLFDLEILEIFAKHFLQSFLENCSAFFLQIAEFVILIG